MRAQSLYYGFREDAIKYLRDSGFVYNERVGWQHPEGFRAIVEFTGRKPDRPWALTIYKSVFQPNRWSISR